MLCPNCQSEVPCSKAPPARRVKLTDEQRVQNKKDQMARWYQANKERRREQNREYMRTYYAQNREVLLERLRESRQRQRDARKAAKEAAATAGMSAKKYVTGGPQLWVSTLLHEKGSMSTTRIWEEF